MLSPRYCTFWLVQTWRFVTKIESVLAQSCLPKLTFNVSLGEPKVWLNVIPFYKCPVGQGDGTLPQQVVSFRRNWNRAEKVKIDTNSIMNTRNRNLTLPLWLAQESLWLQLLYKKGRLIMTKYLLACTKVPTFYSIASSSFPDSQPGNKAIFSLKANLVALWYCSA